MLNRLSTPFFQTANYKDTKEQSSYRSISTLSSLYFSTKYYVNELYTNIRHEALDMT